MPQSALIFFRNNEPETDFGSAIKLVPYDVEKIHGDASSAYEVAGISIDTKLKSIEDSISTARIRGDATAVKSLVGSQAQICSGVQLLLDKYGWGGAFLKPRQMHPRRTRSDVDLRDKIALGAKFAILSTQMAKQALAERNRASDESPNEYLFNKIDGPEKKSLSYTTLDTVNMAENEVTASILQPCLADSSHATENSHVSMPYEDNLRQKVEERLTEALVGLKMDMKQESKYLYSLQRNSIWYKRGRRTLIRTDTSLAISVPAEFSIE